MQREQLSCIRDWIRDVVSDEMSFEKRRRLGLVEATMGSGKTFTIVMELLSETPEDACVRTWDKRLIMCYNKSALENFEAELKFDQRCDCHPRRRHEGCNDCDAERNRAIQNSKLVRILGLTLDQVKELSEHVYFLEKQAEPVTDPTNEGDDAKKFRDAWIVVCTQQILSSRILKHLPADLFSRIIIDEGHHGMSEGNDNENSWNQVCAHP